ncbi:hypothetical protein HOD61_00430 [archaeon]|nr:hypothetical protein [archaeon]
MKKKQKEAIGELFFGLILGVPSANQIYGMIFKSMYESGMELALIGWIFALFLGIGLLLNSLAIALGFKNLDKMIKKLSK